MTKQIILINIENFNHIETKQICDILKDVLKQNITVILREKNLFNNAIHKFYGNKQMDKQTEMLISVAETYQFYCDEIIPIVEKAKHDTSSKFHVIVTEKYFDSIYLDCLDIKFIRENKQALYGFQKIEPSLTLIKKDQSTDIHLNKRISDLFMMKPQRCKILEKIDKREIVEHFLYRLKAIMNNNDKKQS
jgi:hypothetical protein